MIDYLKNIDSIINSFLLNLGIYGPMLGCLLILLESIIPILPLFVFITINFIVFGNVIGFFISWLFTVLGCLMSFVLFRKKIKNWFDHKIENKKRFQQIMKIINTIKIEQLTLIIAVPFTPAFLINIAAGLSTISTKKYVAALCIGKIFLVLFWGFIGTSLIQSLTHPLSLIKVVFLLILAYVSSKLVNKRFKLDE